MFLNKRKFKLVIKVTTLETKTPKDKKNHVVYEIPCKDCNKVYIGQTSQYLKNRLNSHTYDKKNKTALTNHMMETKHNFNYEQTEILKTETNNKKRELLEMIYIQKNNNTVNSKTDTNNLNKIYYNLIQ